MFGFVVASSCATQAGPPSLPATRAFAEWQQGHPATGGGKLSDSQSLATGVELARRRHAELRALMEKDPGEFVRQAMPAVERARLPAEVQPHIERRVSGRGAFAMYCVFPRADEGTEQEAGEHHDGYVREVRLNGAVYRAFVFGNWHNQQTVGEAEIEGVALGETIALGDTPTPAEQAAAGGAVTAYAPSTAGQNTLLYMITQFADQTSDPIAEATALSQLAVVSDFWLNASYGMVSLKGLVHSTQACDFVHIRLPRGATNYVNNFAQLVSDARTAASAQGYSYASYNLDVVVTSSSGFSYAGCSYIGAQGSHWVTPYTTLRTAGHELGHNLGLFHANYWRSDSTQPFGKDSNPGGCVADTVNGEWVEYGHYFSVMSGQYGGEWDDATKPIYNPVEKVKLGWLTGSQVQYVTASGTYRLFRNDARTTVGTPRGIRIEAPATDYSGYGRRYWLQYRYAPWNTARNWYRNGIEVDVAGTTYGSDGTVQLDMTPYSNDQAAPFFDANSKPGNAWMIDNCDKVDGALLVGRSYDDANAGIHITPLATGSHGTGEEYIDVAIHLGTFPGNQPPVISAFSVSTNQVGVGQPVNFSVAATDPDGDGLAYSWDFGQLQVWTASGLNSSSATKSWPSPGQYRVQVRVSDMKGGVATASQVITVGAPASTGQIWGRVLWGGQPVSGARIWPNTWAGAGAAQAWSESDGSYLLSGLPAGSYTLNCQAAGLTFTAQFTNPIPVASGNVYGADFYADQSLPGAGAGSGYTVSGQVTDPVNGVAGVEVCVGGRVATTDAAGNYQLTNLFPGTYSIAARNAGWTFSPASRSVTISSANSTGNSFSRVAPYSISGSFSGVPAGSQNPAPTVYLSNGRSVVATKAGSGKNQYWTYTLNNVPAGQYSVSAFLKGYSIVASGFANPLTISGNVSSANFSGTAAGSIAGAITGRITQYGAPLAGVMVSALQGSSTLGSSSSDSDGYYRIDNLPSGAYQVSLSKSGYTFSSSSINVSSVPSSANNFTVSGPVAPPAISSLGASPSVVPGPTGTAALSAVASGSGPLSYSWDALVAPAPVVFSANDSASAAASLVSFQAAGLYTFRVRATDTNGFAATASVNVTVNAGPGAMVVSPYQVQVSSGQTIAFSVDAWDQLGNRIAVSPAWSAAGGGSIDSNGLFSATTGGGPYRVTATYGALAATGLVWVTSSADATSPLTVVQPPAISATNGSVTISWGAIPGTRYRVQYQESLGDGTWNALGPDLTATEATASISDSAGATRRFYRIQLVR